MVDLVKIRKKAKEKAAAAAEGRGPQVAEAAVPAPKVPGRRSQVAEETKAAVPSVKAEEKRSEPQKEAAAPPPKDAALVTAPMPSPHPAPDTPHPTPEPRQPTATQQLTSKLARFLETAGDRRVESSKDSKAAAEEQIELLTFSIAGEVYAITIDNVVEIVTPRAMTRIPNSDPLVVGILSLRGMIVTLIDARRRLGHPATEAATPDTRIIVVQLDHETLGFSVDRVQRVLKIGVTAIEPHPVVHASEQDDSVRGVFRHADSLTILLDLDKLLNTSAAVASA